MIVNEKIESTKDALDLLTATLGKIHDAGFRLNAVVTVTDCRGSTTLSSENWNGEMYIDPKGIWGRIRITPKPCGTQNAGLSPQKATDTLSDIEKRISVATTGIGATVEPPLSDGITRDGSVCSYCGGTTFERRGSCLYCRACGNSVGGCS